VILGAVLIGGLLTVLSGLVLQWRTERRRMRGAAVLVAAELRTNAAEVAHFFLNEQIEQEGREQAGVSMPIRVGDDAWHTYRSELAQLADVELLQQLIRLYKYVDRFNREPRLQRPNMHEHMRDTAGDLERLAQKSWKDRLLLL
jgi:hypothetical protein